MGHVEFQSMNSPVAMSEVERSTAAILESFADAVVVLNTRAEIIFLNRAGENLFGRPRQTLIGRAFRALPLGGEIPDFIFKPGMGPIAANDIAPAPRRVRVEVCNAQGQLFAAELTATNIVHHDHGLQVIQLRDLRCDQAGEMRSARAGALNDLSAALAHELNQPMTALTLYLQTAKASLAFEGEGRPARGELIDKALRETERAVAIIQRMRQFAQRRRAAHSPLDLDQLIDEAVELAFVGQARRPLVLRDIADDLPSIVADPVQIEQVLVNLLKNAAEAMADMSDARITIRAAREGGALHLSVSDNGPGIAPERAQTLFTAFAPTRKATGLGLGLAICRAIAQGHGGNLVCGAASDTGGASFTLILPLSSAKADRNTARGALGS